MTIPIHDGLLQIFNVDHGQCALLTMPVVLGRARRILIDCGHSVSFNGRPWYPGEHLQHLGIEYIDLLICTNYDEDHASGYPDLTRRGITVGSIFGNPTVSPSTIMYLKSEDGMGPGIQRIAQDLQGRRDIGWEQTLPEIPGVQMRWVCNRYGAFEDENNLSLVFIVDVLGFRFMFPGDMERRGWRHALEHFAPFRQWVAGVDILVAAHHGRENGICEELFDVYGCRPKVVVISDDYKQHASQETTNYYGRKAAGVWGFRNELGVRRVLTTRSDGELRFSFSQGNCYVS